MDALIKPRLSFAAGAALLTFLFHLAANPHYGFFRDELYFIICGFHPAWGYVDQPPVTPLLAAASQLFGHSLFLLRAIPAAFAAGSVYVVCRLVQEFGGGTFAMVLAAICAALSPVLAAFGEKVGPDMVGLWLWPLALLYIVRIVNGGDARQWIWAGVAIGISAESKYSVLYFALAFLIALLIAPQRRLLYSKWFAAAAGIAIAIALPSVLWQAAHQFPIVELLRAGQAGKNVVLTPAQYLLAEFLITGPVLALVWMSGLVWLALTPRLRFLAYGYALLIIMMIASHAKHYYPADVYPLLFAAGGAALEQWTAPARWLRPVAVALAVVGGLFMLPYVEPILPERDFIAYNGVLGPHIGTATATEHHKSSSMTQDWADMHGWPQLAATVERVYNALTPAERAQAVVFAQNYGEASAVAFFTTVPVISGHNQYYLWGTLGKSGDVLIDIDGHCMQKLHLYRSATKAATFSNPYVMPYENDMPIYVCRGITRPLLSVWPYAKHYD
ncbi:MAG: glycosyltransferase family 39 protein [Candidatus Eremiobacteraeota bacterium]|nr:glycosyltransferase family 39 protein [Candidatus Eremiobacteraeota bacterium]